MKSWLITGGAGFIGCHFVRKLATITNDPIIILDSMTYAANIESIKDILSDRVQLLKEDITNINLVKSTFEQHNITHVVHFAAESHVDNSINGPYGFIKTNVFGTFNLLEAARHFWKDKKDTLFVHVSTDEVYGSLELNDHSLDESAPYKPNSPYAASKAASNHLALAWNKTYKLPVIVSLCCNNFGPWQHEEKFIPVVITRAIKGTNIPIYGDGLYVREWIHVEDHCDAIMTLIEHGSVGETYNISSSDEWSNIKVSEMICDNIDAIKYLPHGSSRKLLSYVKDRPGHDRRYSINSSKLRSLGWKPKRYLSQCIRELVEWYYARTSI